MCELIQIITTVDNQEKALKIAENLVQRKLAGCVQVSGPITSTYWWEGKVETSKEWYCIIKTLSNLYKEVEAAILSIHPYEVPEILALPIIGGNPAYLNWLYDSINTND